MIPSTLTANRRNFERETPWKNHVLVDALLPRSRSTPSRPPSTISLITGPRHPQLDLSQFSAFRGVPSHGIKKETKPFHSPTSDTEIGDILSPQNRALSWITSQENKQVEPSSDISNHFKQIMTFKSRVA